MSSDELLAGVVLAERTSPLGEEALSFQILFAHRAVEALAMVVIVQGFHPTISSFDWESASETFRGEEFVPISIAVGVAILQEERIVAEQFSTVNAVEAFRMEVLSDGLQAISFNFAVTLGARWGQVLFEAVFAVQLSPFLDESEILEGASAGRSRTYEMLRAPDFAKGCYKWSPDLTMTLTAQWNSGTGQRRSI